jgi:hypothetical protein
MLIKTKIRFNLSLLLLLISLSGNAQEINVELKNVDSLSITNTESRVLDINGEICSLVILTTDLEGLKFYSNLGVENIEKTDTGYNIWIPNQANVLKFIIPGFPLFEYKLPHSVFKYSVYIILLKAEKYEKIIIADTLQPSLSITTFPTKARIYLNSRYQGRSPIIINNPDFDKFDYSIKKISYGSYASMDSMDRKTKNLSVNLKDLSHNKMLFLTLNAILDLPMKSEEFHDYGDYIGMLGFTCGIIGKTGIYGSLNYLYTKNTTGADMGKKISIGAGITRQLGRSIFFYGGPAYTNRSYKYFDYTLSDYSESKVKSIDLCTGIIFRIAWYTLLQINFGKSLTSSYFSYGLSMGFNFPLKANNPTKIQSISE